MQKRFWNSFFNPLFFLVHGEIIGVYFLFYDDNSKKQESRENRGAMIIIPSELDIFRNQNTKDSKNYNKWNFSLDYSNVWHNLLWIII